MKQTLITLLFLCSLSAQMIAQKYTVTDTTYTTNSAGVFFTVRDIVYSNGEETHTKTRIGDTLALFDAFYNRFVNTAAQMSTDARYAITFPALIGDMNRDNNLLLATTGKDALDTVTARLSAPLLEDGWKLRTSGAGAEDVVFIVNNNGQLRYTITGFTTRNATLFGQVIRLNNYKDGTAIDLYQVASGNYKTINNSITLRRPGGPANRSVTAPPPDPDTILAEPKNGTPVTPVESATPAKAGGTGTGTKKTKKKRRQ